MTLIGTQIENFKNDLRRSVLRSICAICVPSFIDIDAGSPAVGLFTDLIADRQSRRPGARAGEP